LHDFICSFANIAVANFTRLRPSRTVPASPKRDCASRNGASLRLDIPCLDIPASTTAAARLFARQPVQTT